MKIAQKYSHLNGEEYLLVHHKDLYSEIKTVISSISAEDFRTKKSKEKTMRNKMLFSPKALNKEFDYKFSDLEWKESRYKYFITLDRKLMEETISMEFKDQKNFLISKGIASPIQSFK